jgi:hypothetical protein
MAGCLGSGAFDMALETAHDVARRAVQTEEIITATCEQAILHDVPGALVRCDAAWDAYDRAAKAVDALLAALEAAKAAEALGQDPDEAGLLRASLAAGKAMRELDAAMRAIGGES